MTVKELKKKLEKYDDELDVFINDAAGPAAITRLARLDDPENCPDEWNMPAEWIEIKS